MLNFKKKLKLNNILENQTLWIITTCVLAAIFMVYALFEYSQGFRDGIQGLFDKLQAATTSQSQTEETKGPAFQLPMTLVYSSTDPDQKKLLDKFLASIGDPTQGLSNTKVQAKWLDYQDPAGAKIIKDIDAKYLPVVILDKTVENHPQFKDLSSYLNQKGNLYVLRLSPLQFLQTPSASEGLRSNALGLNPNRKQVDIVEFASFTCSHCANMSDVLQKIMKNYAGKVALIYKHFDRGGADSLLGQGAECAGEQKKFFPMHDAIFKSQNDLITSLQTAKTDQELQLKGREFLDAKAKTVGLNSKNFKACMESGKNAAAIQSDSLEAFDYGVNGTPAFFINGKYIDGEISYDQMKSTIDEQLKTL